MQANAESTGAARGGAEASPPAPPRLVSFVAPAHNEVDALPRLLEEIRGVAPRVSDGYEIVIVDDGSSDGTGAWLDREAAAGKDLRVFHHPRNRGQSAALASGIALSRGDVIVTLDADLQNDPADAGKLIEAIRAGADFACGVRARRRDTISKRLASRFANRFRRLFLRGDDFRDVGCSLKAWRRPVAMRLPRFHGFHRFLPILARAEGFRVVEVAVNHRPRTTGKTHYGNFGRAVRGLYDLVGVAWLLRRRIDWLRPEDRPPGA